MDVVYILGTGSKWNDNEIRYSLRSLEKHFPHRKVFIVGEFPSWLQNVEHIDIQDIYANVHGGKFKNVIRKIRGACEDTRVSDSFVLMNDDFFFLEDCTEIRPYSVGSLDAMIERFKAKYRDDGRNQYVNALSRTARILKKFGVENAVSYSIHYPIVHDKEKFLRMTDEIEWLEKAASWRTIYGNLFFTNNIERADPKVSSEESLEVFLAQEDKGDFLSISDNVALTPRFQEWIQTRFSTPSRYEKVIPI